MIEYLQGNLLDVTEGIIVHGCNAQGVMGSGVAKAVKEKYPGAFDQYVDDLDKWMDKFQSSGYNLLGLISCYHVNDTLRIASAITQLNYGRHPNKRYVSYDAIDDAFKSIGNFARKDGWNIHLPRIGAGLGNGDWDVISEIINCRTVGVNVTCWEL